jgi:shikimate dehydrogenase
MNRFKRACVAGWPISHSRSPLIHNHWLSVYDIDGAYGIEAVRPEDFPGFLASLGERGYVGANLTVPHKEAALRLADEADAVAAAIGAANTVWLDDGRLLATNTDCTGFTSHLEDTAPEWKSHDGPVAVLGAGGAARAIVYGLEESGVAEIWLFNRTRSRAERLAEDFGSNIRVFDWRERSARIGDCMLLVNTTALGMTGAPELEIDLGMLPATAVIMDIVYVPLATALLRQARARGLKTVDGLGMLLHQAVPAFEKWFGVRPRVTDELRRIVIADLAAELC